MHLEDPADAFLLVADRVVDRVAGLQDARVHAHERQLADIRVGHQLEREGGELLGVVGATHDRLVVFVHARNRRHVDGRRHEFDHGVEHALHALVLERGAAQHRLDLGGDRARADGDLDFVFGEVTDFEVLVHHLFARLGSRFEHVLAPLDGLGLQFFRDLPVVELHALRGLVPEDRLHLDEVDHALEVFLGADGDDDGNGVGLEANLHLVIDLVEVRAGAVHLVDEREAGHLVLVGLAPDGFRLGLHAAHGAVHHAGAVEHAHRALDFDREVDVARGVDDVDAVFWEVAFHALPEARRGRGRDRDATLLLLLHPVHRGSAVVHFTDLVVHTGVEQDPFGGRGLAGIDVRGDTDVAVALDGGLAGHGVTLQIQGPLKGWYQPGERPEGQMGEFRSGSARTPCWLRPCGELRHASSWRRRGLRTLRAVHWPGGPTSTSRHACGRCP